jgi:hypothetical protein
MRKYHCKHYAQSYGYAQRGSAQVQSPQYTHHYEVEGVDSDFDHYTELKRPFS